MNGPVDHSWDCHFLERTEKDLLVHEGHSERRVAKDGELERPLTAVHRIKIGPISSAGVAADLNRSAPLHRRDGEERGGGDPFWVGIALPRLPVERTAVADGPEDVPQGDSQSLRHFE